MSYTAKLNRVQHCVKYCMKILYVWDRPEGFKWMRKKPVFQEIHEGQMQGHSSNSNHSKIDSELSSISKFLNEYK